MPPNAMHARLRLADLLECGERNGQLPGQQSVEPKRHLAAGPICSADGWLRQFYHLLHSQIHTFPVARLTRALSSLGANAI